MMTRVTLALLASLLAQPTAVLPEISVPTQPKDARIDHLDVRYGVLRFDGHVSGMPLTPGAAPALRIRIGDTANSFPLTHGLELDDLVREVEHTFRQDELRVLRLESEFLLFRLPDDHPSIAVDVEDLSLGVHPGAGRS